MDPALNQTLRIWKMRGECHWACVAPSRIFSLAVTFPGVLPAGNGPKLSRQRSGASPPTVGALR